MNKIPIEVIRSDIVFRLVESKMWMNFIKLTDKCNPISRHYMFKVHGMQSDCKFQVPTDQLKMGYGLQYAVCNMNISDFSRWKRATCHEIGRKRLYNNTQHPFVYSILQCELWHCRATVISLNDSVLFLFATWSMIKFWIENLSFAIMIQFNRIIHIIFPS